MRKLDFNVPSVSYILLDNKWEFTKVVWWKYDLNWLKIFEKQKLLLPHDWYKNLWVKLVS